MNSTLDPFLCVGVEYIEVISLIMNDYTFLNLLDQ